MPDAPVSLSVEDKARAEQIVVDMERIIKDYVDTLDIELAPKRNILKAKVDECYSCMMSPLIADYNQSYEDFTEATEVLREFDTITMNIIYARRVELMTNLRETHPHILI